MRGIVRGLAVPGAGGGGGGITGLNFSAGTTSNGISDSIVFSNSNNVTFGLNGSTITASVAAGGGGITNINVSAGTTSNLLSAITFSNLNGVSFGLNASTITGSIATSLTAIRVSAGITSNLLSALTFSNINGISFGLDASTITASYTVPAVTNSSWTVSDSATSGTVARLAFSNLNGITLSLSTGAGGSHTIVGSYTVPTVTNSSWTVSDSATSGTVARLAFSNLNGITLSLSTGAGGSHTVVGSYTVPTVTNSSWTVSDSATSGSVARLAFTNLNGVTFSLSTGAGGSHTLVGSVAAVGGAQTGISGIANSQTTYTSGTVSLSDQANITIASSVNGATQIYKFSVAAQSTQPAVNAFGASNTGNTAGDTGTSSGITWVMAGSNNITISESTVGGGPNTLWVSGPSVGGAQTGISGIANSQTTYTSGTVSLSDQANITIASSVNGATQIYRFSVAAQSTQPAVNALGVSNTGNTAGNTGTSSGITWVFAGSNANTLSQSTAGGGPNTIWIQGPVSATTISAVSAANVIGTRGSRFALEDHQHAGVFSAGASNVGSTAGNTTVVPGRFVFAGSGIVTVSQETAANSLNTLHIQATQSNQAFSAAGGSSAFQTLSFGDTNSVSWTNTNGSVGIASIKLQMFAVSNTTQSSSGTANHTALSFGGAGIASVGVTGGSVVISVPSGGGAGDGGNTIAAGTRTASSSAVLLFSDSNNFTWGLNAVNGTVLTASYSVPTQTLSLYALGNTTQNSSTALNATQLSYNGLGAATWGYSNGSIQVSVPNTSSIVGARGLTVDTAGSTISVQPIFASSFENMVQGIQGSSAMTWGGTSLSHAAAFDLRNAISFDFLRMPVLMTTNSTTIATLVSATASASGGISSTVNFVLYSLGVGANSKSLQSVTSGSNGFTFSQRISITNSTQYSISQGLSFQANGAGTSRSTQYSISNTNYSFSTNQIATEWSSARMLDISGGGSLTPGPYWIVMGYSSSSQTGGAAGLAAITNCNVRYSAHYGVSQGDISFGIMGSTNRTSGGLMGAGSFSTAGGGTTNSIPISAISSIASLAKMYFQLLRSA